MEIEGITIVAENVDEYWFALGTMFNRDIPSAYTWGDCSFFTPVKSWEQGLEYIAKHKKEVNILMCRHFRFRRNVKWRLLHNIIHHVLCGTIEYTSYCGEQVKDWNPSFQVFFLTAEDSPGYIPHRSMIAPGTPRQVFGAVAMTPEGAQTLLKDTILDRHQGIWHSYSALVERSEELRLWRRANE